MFTEWEIQDIFKTGEDAPTTFKPAVLREEDIDPEFPGGRPYTQNIELEKLSELNGGLPFTSHMNKVAFSWDEIVSQPLEKTVPSDGVVTEKNGKQTWRYFYQTGKCVRMELEDLDLPGAKMLFDGEGNEIAA